MISIRLEKSSDIEPIRVVNELAFGQRDEAAIVDSLREACPDLLSLVAVSDEEIVGHILFSPVTIENDDFVWKGMGLAPMSVLPAYQRQGIGTTLVETGLKCLQEQSCLFVVVLGHPNYYPRFGFSPASTRDIMSQWNGVADEAFMIIVLDTEQMKEAQGVAYYRDEFG